MSVLRLGLVLIAVLSIQIKCNLILNCGDANSGGLVEWQKDNLPIDQQNDKYELLTNGSLRIFKQTMGSNSANGVFKCLNMAHVGRGKFIEAIIQLNPNPSGSNSSDLKRNKTIQRGHTALLECETNVTAETKVVTYEWFKDARLVNPDRRHFIHDNGSLEIRNASNSDDCGLYRCHVKIQNPLQTVVTLVEIYLNIVDIGINQTNASTTVTLFDTWQKDTVGHQIHTEPVFVRRPANMTKPINSDVVFECEVDGLPTPTVKWYKNGELIWPSEYFQYENQTNLRILGIIKQDEGYYQCIATNSLKSAIATAYLYITTATINDKQRNQDTIDFKQIKLTRPANVSLHKSQKTIYLNWTESRLYHTNTTSALLDNQRHPPIVYLITWKAYVDKQIFSVNTTGLYQKIENLMPNWDYQINISALCDTTIKSETITYENVRVDNGDNAVPYDIEVEFLTDQIVKIKWKFDLWPDLLKFRLFIIQKPIGQQQQTADVDQPVHSTTNRIDVEKYLDIHTQHLIVANQNQFAFILEDLKKFCIYTFRLVAYTRDAKRASNKSSQSMEIRTQSDVPDGAPENIVTECLNTTAIRVTWDRPQWDKCNGLIIGYRLVLKFDEQVKNFNLDSEPKSFVLNQLIPGKKYSLRMMARNANGTGPASDWLITKTYSNDMTENRVPGQPFDVFTDATSDTSVFVRWSPPVDSNTTIIRRYLLKYGVFMPDNEIEIDASKNSYLIENLLPSSQYILSLKAGNNIGYGRELLKEVVTKRKAELNGNDYLFPPLNLHGNAIAQTVIDLSWTDWHLKDDEQIVDERYYCVRYALAETDRFKYKNSTERSVRIDDLNASTLYDFAVKLIMGSRESDWSLTTSQMTMEASMLGQTNAPRDIRFKSEISKNYVNTIVSWEMDVAKQDTESSTVFIVSYADEQLFKQNKWKQEYMSKDLAIVHKGPYDIEMQVEIHKLRPNTIYYVKIQERNNRGDYKAESSIVLYKTPNLSGLGDTIIKSLEQKFESKRPGNDRTESTKDDNYFVLWVVVPVVAVILVLLLTIGLVLALRRPAKSTNKIIKDKHLLINTTGGHLGSEHQQQPQQQQHQTWLSCTNPTNSSTYGGVVTNTNTTSDNCTSSSILSGPISSSTTTSTIKQQQRLQMLIQNNDDYLINEQLQPLNQQTMSSPNDYLLQRSQCFVQQPSEEHTAGSCLKQNCFSSTQQRKFFKSPLIANTYDSSTTIGNDFNNFLFQQKQQQSKSQFPLRSYRVDSQAIPDMDPVNQYAMSNFGSDYACHSPCSSISSSQTHQYKQQTQYDKISTVLSEMNAANRNFSTKLKSFTPTNSQQQLMPTSMNVSRAFASPIDSHQSQIKNKYFNNQYLMSKHDTDSVLSSTVTPFLLYTNNSIENIYDDSKNLHNKMPDMDCMINDLASLQNQQAQLST